MDNGNDALHYAGTDRYRIHSRVEILSLLHALIVARTFVSVSWGSGDAFIVTAILGVNSAAEEFVIDCGADAAANRALLRAPLLSFATLLDHIRIEFDTGSAETEIWDDRPALRVHLPASVLRLQRREWYRCALPSRPGIVARIPVPCDSGGAPSAVDVRVRDLSCGGLGLVDWPPELEVAPGVTLGDCRIELPEVGTIVAELAVVNVIDEPLRNGASRRRCGCRFVRLPQRAITLIQRFVHRLERSRRQRA